MSDKRALVTDDNFARTMILCPTYDGLSRPAELSLEAFKRLGATVLRSDGISGVTEHRNAIAGAALNLLDKRRESPFWWVLWFDGDMALDVEAFRAMVHYALQLTPKVETDGKIHWLTRVDGTRILESDAGDPLKLTPMVSAAYVTRTDPSKIASVLLEEYPTREVLTYEDPTGSKATCFPTLNGLGATLQSAPAFWDQVANSPRTSAVNDPNGMRPLAFQSAGLLLEKDADTLTYFSEDFWYCRTAWTRAVGCYLVPVMAGHVVSRVAFPDPGVIERLRDAATRRPTDPAPAPGDESGKPSKQ